MPTWRGLSDWSGFWQWFSYKWEGSSIDKGQVQISTWNGSVWGTWSTLATPVDASSPSDRADAVYNSGWSKCAVELTAYAGQTVRVAFTMRRVKAPATMARAAVGIWITCKVWKGVPQMPVLEGFESGWGDRYAENGVWEVGAPSSGGSVSGTKIAAAGLSGDYPDQTDSRLIGPPFLVPPDELKPEIRFWQRYSYGAWGTMGMFRFLSGLERIGQIG